MIFVLYKLFVLFRFCSWIINHYTYQKYVADGSVSKKQQMYENVVNQPLITGAGEDLILTILAIPELHLLLGEFFFIQKVKSFPENYKQMGISALCYLFI